MTAARPGGIAHRRPRTCYGSADHAALSAGLTRHIHLPALTSALPRLWVAARQLAAVSRPDVPCWKSRHSCWIVLLLLPLPPGGGLSVSGVMLMTAIADEDDRLPRQKNCEAGNRPGEHRHRVCSAAWLAVRDDRRRRRSMLNLRAQPARPCGRASLLMVVFSVRRRDSWRPAAAG